MRQKNILKGRLYCLTAEKFSRGRSNLEVVKEMLAAGVKIIQYREKEKEMGEKYEECLELRAMTKKAGASLIINDDVDLALAVEADGVHIGQKDLPIEVVRDLLEAEMIIGVSTHSPQQAEAAVKAGADYIGVGPIFATDTKKDVCAPVGLEYLSYVVNNLEIPHVAIGGIKEHNLEQVINAGAQRVAMVTEIVEAENIQRKIKSIQDKI